MKRFLLGVFALSWLVALPVSAQVYRCVANGAVTISTEPCPVGAASTEFKQEDAAAREAAKKAADEEVARIKEKTELMARERRERDATIEANRQEASRRAPAPAITPAPVEEGIVERTVILPTVPPYGVVPGVGQRPGMYRPPYRPHRPPPHNPSARPDRPDRPAGSSAPVSRPSSPSSSPPPSPSHPVAPRRGTSEHHPSGVAPGSHSIPQPIPQSVHAGRVAASAIVRD